MSLIQGSDSFLDVVTKMSKGNPGAINVLCLIIKEGASIDPECIIGVMGPLCTIDNLELYGSRLYLLYNDVCERNLARTLAVLRANQLGIVSKLEIDPITEERIGAREAIAAFDLKAVYDKVRKRLPTFDP